MPTSSPIVPLDRFNVDQPIGDLDVVRSLNPQRYEMEQLTAVLYEDLDTMSCVAVNATSVDDFWVRGHMPGMPLMPGVMMLESVAQLASFFAQKHDLLGTDMIGFGGLDEVRFRGIVTPGDRLVLMVRLVKARRGRMLLADFQAFVKDSMVLEGKLRGIPIPIDFVKQTLAERGVTVPAE